VSDRVYSPAPRITHPSFRACRGISRTEAETSAAAHP
jgi:hypothetical protein